MRGLIALVLCIFLILPTLIYAQNLNIDLYTETEELGKRYGNIRAKPGDEIEAFIELENENLDRSDNDQEIEDIEVTVTIEDIDDGSDIEEDYKDRDLRARKDESIPLFFTVPLRVEDRNYAIKIEVEATENGTDFSKDEDFVVNIIKKEHELYFKELKFEPAEIKCNELSYLEMNIYNLGKEDENIEMTITNQELGYVLKRAFELGEYPGKDTYKNSIPIKAPLEAEAGKYEFKISLSYSGLIENKIVELNVTCGEEKTKISDENGKNGQDTITTSTTSPRRLEGSKVVVKDSSDNAPIYLLVLLVLVAIALFAIIKLKKR